MPALPFLLIPGAIFFAGMLLVAFSVAHSSTTRPHAESSGVLSGLTWATDLVGKAWNKLVRATVSHFAVAHLIPLVRWFGSMNALVIGVAATLADVAEDLARSVERVAHVTVPREARKSVAPVKAQAKRAEGAASHAGAAAKTAAGSVAKLRSDVQPRVAHVERSVAVTLPREIAHVNKRVAEVEHALRSPDRLLTRRWAKRLWAGGLALLVSRWLVRKLPWLFCRQVKQLAPRICSLPFGLLDALLVGTLAVIGTISLQSAARELIGLFDTIEGAVTGWVSELHGVPMRSAAQQGFVASAGSPHFRTPEEQGFA